MNHIYKVIWSKAKNAYVVTSEIAKTYTKSAGSRAGKLAAVMAAAAVLSFGFSAPAVQAADNPTPNSKGEVTVKASDVVNDEVTVTDVAKKSDLDTLKKAGIVAGTVTPEGTAIAIGSNSKVTSNDGWTGAVAIGNAATVSWDKDSEAAKKARELTSPNVHGWGMLAIGDGATVKDSYFGVMIGSKGTVKNSIFGTAFGGNNNIDNSYAGAAFGSGATVVNSDSGTSLGAATKVINANKSLALGAGSMVAGRDNTVSIGRTNEDIKAYNKYVDEYNAEMDKLHSNDPHYHISKYKEDGSQSFNRQITGVAAGTEANDVATVGQVQDGYVAYEKKDNAVNKDFVTFAGGEKGTALKNVGDITMKVPYQDASNNYTTVYKERSFQKAGLMPGEVTFDDKFKPDDPYNEKEVKGNVVAIGHNAKSYNSSGSTVVGEFSNIDSSHWTTALGAGVTVKNSSQSVSIGNGSAITDSVASVAVGQNSKVFHSDQSSSIGVGAQIYGEYVGKDPDGNYKYTNVTDNIALGTYSSIDSANSSVALGAYSTVEKGQDKVVSVGKASTNLYRKVINAADGTIAIGSHDLVTGGQLAAAGIIPGKTDGTVDSAENQASLSVAIGQKSNAENYQNTAVGAYASTAGNQKSTAIGFNAKTYNNHSVALGAESQVRVEDYDNADGSDGIVSVGKSGNGGFTRRIINVKDGVNPTDAVNKSQLDEKADITDLDGYVAYDKTGEAVDKTSVTFNKDGEATALKNVASVNGLELRGDKETVAVGVNSKATADGATAVGANSQAAQNAVAIGKYTKTANGSVAIGLKADASDQANQAVALGYLAKATKTSSVALGANSVADEGGTVSVGKSSADANGNAFTRRIVNVTAGVNGTDAVNKSQLDAVSEVAGKGFSVAIPQADGSVQEHTYKPGDTITFTSNNDNLLTAIADDGTIDVRLNDTLHVGSVQSANGKSVLNLTDGGTSLGYVDGDNTHSIAVDENGTKVNGHFQVTTGQGTPLDVTADTVKAGGVTLKNGTVFTGNKDQYTDISATMIGNTVTKDGHDYTATIDGQNGLTVADYTGLTRNAYTRVDAKGVETTGYVKAGYVETGYVKAGNVTVNDNGKITGLTAGSALTDAATVGQLQTSAKASKTEVKGGTNVSVTDTTSTEDGHTIYTVNVNKTLTGMNSIFFGEGTDNGLSVSGLKFGGKTFVSDAGFNANNTVITNVKAGEKDTDAVNKKQMTDAISTATNGSVKWDNDQKDSINSVGLKDGKVTADKGISAGGGKFTIEQNGNLNIGDKFKVDAETGNTTVSGDLDVSGDLKVKGQDVATSGDVSGIKTQIGVDAEGNYLKIDNGGNSVIAGINKNTADIKTNTDSITKIKDTIGGTGENGALKLANGEATIEKGINANTAAIKTNTDNIGATGENGALKLENGATTIENGINANTDAIQRNSTAINNLGYSVNKLGGEIDSVGALSAALAGLHPLDYDASNSKYQLAAAFGGYDGSYALALGGFYNVNKDILLSGGVSTILKGDRKTAGNVGVTFRVGAGNSAESLGVATNLNEANQRLAALSQDNKVLAGQNRKLSDQVAAQDQKLAAQDKKLADQDKKLAELAAQVAALAKNAK